MSPVCSDPLSDCRVRTGSRLHFGPLTWPGPGAERPDFGGLGLMVEAPETVVTSSPGHALTVVEQPTRHVGLGTGTQQALAVAYAEGHRLDAAALANTTGRGVRSAIGLHGFCHGGLLLDGGRPNGEPIGRLLRRVEVPTDWPVRLVRLDDRVGLFGPDERAAFATLPPMPDQTSHTLRELADAAMVAAASGSLDWFAAAVTEYGTLVGDFFAPVQGNRFADPRWNQLLEPLRDLGCGVAQSSWGPTVAVIGGHDADAIAGQLCGAYEVVSTKVRNEPATRVPLAPSSASIV